MSCIAKYIFLFHDEDVKKRQHVQMHACNYLFLFICVPDGDTPKHASQGHVHRLELYTVYNLKGTTRPLEVNTLLVYVHFLYNPNIAPRKKKE